MITPFALDQELLLLLNFNGGSTLDQIMYIVSGKLTWVPLYGLIVWLVYRAQGWRGALLFLVMAAMMVLCADQTASLAKTYLPKFRPTHYPHIEDLVHTVNGYRGGLYGTISSHASNSFGLVMLASLTLSRRWITISLVAWATLVAYSRIYLGVHYPLDILLGTAEGVLWGYLWFKIGAYIRQKIEPTEGLPTPE